MTAIHCEVAILGAGAAGLAAAISLARDGVDTVVLERGTFETRRVGEHVPPEIRPLLYRLGYPVSSVGERHLQSDGVIGTWDDDESVGRDYLYSAYGLGLNLTRPLFDRELAKLARKAGAKVLTGLSIVLRSGPPDWLIQAESDALDCSVCCRFVVDATGRSSWLSRKLRATRSPSKAPLAAIAYIETDEPIRDTRLKIEKRDATWWYTLPLHDGTQVVAQLGLTAERLRNRRDLQKSWLAELQRTELISAQLIQPGEPDLLFCAASPMLPTEMCGEYWMAIGDAACTFNPLAGRGVTKALEDGLQASDRISRSKRLSYSQRIDYRQETRAKFDLHQQKLKDFGFAA